MARIMPGREVMPMLRVNNGPGRKLVYLMLILLLCILISFTLMTFPAAGSAPPPQWVWDDEGRVTDATGQYRRLTDEEACEMYDLCPQVIIMLATAGIGSGSEGSDGGPSDGGGCR